MYIVSADGRYVYGYCIAADTGGFIHDVDWTVDLFMNSTEQCINWGRRDVIIFIL
jgi:3D (Asp-Asp-Asp) domain-containing protein